MSDENYIMKQFNENFVIQPWQLAQRQAESLEHKEKMTMDRIKPYITRCNGKTYVSLSGGKDSTVLLHLVRRVYPDCEALFIDTGLEYPEVKAFIETIGNVTTVRPKLSFVEVIEKYGYPVVSKDVSQKIHEIRTTGSKKLLDTRLAQSGNGHLSHKWRFLLNAPFKISDKCCHVMKKAPAKAFEKATGKSAIVGTMASDSRNRATSYLRNGCTSFKGRNMSTPLAFWLEKDIWAYIKKYNLPYSKIYDMGYERTGCMWCMFGLNLDENDRFDRMKVTHPKIHNYCMNKLGLEDIIYYVRNCHLPMYEFLFKKERGLL